MLLFFNCRENVNQAKKYPVIPGHTRQNMILAE